MYLVLGVDLSPQQPNFLPPNLKFEVDDLEERWLYHQKFDYIHARDIGGSLKDWPKFFKQAFEFTAPGGYIELTDALYPFKSDDGSLDGTAVLKWSQLIHEATIVRFPFLLIKQDAMPSTNVETHQQKSGRPLCSRHERKTQIETAGYISVTERTDIWPCGRWPKDARLKEIGVWCRENVLIGLEGFSLALFTRVLGWSTEEVQLFLVDVRRDMGNPNIHWYVPMYTVYGRKPE